MALVTAFGRNRSAPAFRPMRSTLEKQSRLALRLAQARSANPFCSNVLVSRNLGDAVRGEALENGKGAGGRALAQTDGLVQAQTKGLESRGLAVNGVAPR